MNRMMLALLMVTAALPTSVWAQPRAGGRSTPEAPVTSLPPVGSPLVSQESAPAPSTWTLVSETSDARACRLSLFVDYLYWNVHGADVPYAQAYDGIDPFLSVPRGPVAVVSPQYQSGFRVGGGLSVAEDQWLVGTYTYFRTDRSNQIKAPDGFVLHNFLAFPNTANSAVDSLTARADYEIRLQMADLDYKCAFIHTESLLVNWLTGFRYAHIDQNLLSTFQLTGTTTVDSRVNFDGFGPRVGLEGTYRLPCGLYGYTNGIVDLLFGQFRGSSVERNVFTGLVGSTSITANRPVPVLELELGAGWQSADGNVRISAGYYVGSWCNTVTLTSLSSAIGNVNFTTNGNNFRDNLVFDGFVVRCELRF